MDDDEGERCGFLDVKVPSKARSKGIRAWKAWRRRWVVLQCLENLKTGRRLVQLDLCSAVDQEAHLRPGDAAAVVLRQRTGVILEGTVSVRRTHSKSHPYAFAVTSDGHEASVHLSGSSETDSQAWIRAIRSIVRPVMPTPPRSHAETGQVFEASLIECLSDGYFGGGRGAGWRRLAAPVGFIAVLPKALLLLADPLEGGSDSVLAELPPSAVRLTSLVKSALRSEDAEKIFVIEVVDVLSSKFRLRFYSDKAKDVTLALSAWKTSADVRSTLPTAEAREVALKTSSTASDEAFVIKSSSSDSKYADAAVGVQPEALAINSVQSIPKLSFHRASLFGRGQTVVQLKSSMTKSRLSRSDTELYSTVLEEIAADVEDDDTSSPPASAVTEPATVPDSSSTTMTSPVQQSDGGRVDDRRPVSSYSSTSQVSNDSGVMMSAPTSLPADDEGRRPSMPPKTRRPPLAAAIGSNVEDGPAYRSFAELLQCDDDMKILYENLSDAYDDGRMSTSSDSTIYSEIGEINCQDNLYEDLDKFRKNIHKLLGIPQSIVLKDQRPQQQDDASGPLPQFRRPAPPELPPRRYKASGSSGVATLPLSGVVRRKDVMKFLGASVDKPPPPPPPLPPPSALSVITTEGQRLQHHKNIYRYLGIPTMAFSQPTNLNAVVEATTATYDSPVSIRHRAAPHLASATMNVRKCSRTYVRVSSSSTTTTTRTTMASAFVADDVSGRSTDNSNKTLNKKKKRMTFLRRKTSKDDEVDDGGRRKSKAGNTYVSYELHRPEDWREIRDNSPAIKLAPMAIDSYPHVDDDSPNIVEQLPSRPPRSPPSQIVSVTPTSDDRTIDNGTDERDDSIDIIEDAEHYCVPLASVVVPLRPNPEPFYVNVAELQLESTVSSINQASVQQQPKSVQGESASTSSADNGNYLEMGVASTTRSSSSSSSSSRSSSSSGGSSSELAACIEEKEDESEESDPLAILKSVISCIDELKAICHDVPKDGSRRDEAADTTTTPPNEHSRVREGFELRQRLSSYIDELFSAHNMGIAADDDGDAEETSSTAVQQTDIETVAKGVSLHEEIYPDATSESMSSLLMRDGSPTSEPEVGGSN